MLLVYVYDVARNVVIQEVQEDIVILSPSLYWYKSCSIPTKNLLKAKNIAKHMMSDRPASLSSMVLYKKENHFDAYAYDKNFVKSLLKELNLPNPKVYFANQLHIKETLSIDDETMLYSFDSRVLQSKRNDVEMQSLASNIKELLTNEKPIKEFLRSDKNESKMLIGIVALMLIFVVLYSIDKMMVLSNIQKSQVALSSKEHSDISFYEMQSLIKRYDKQEKSSAKLKQELNKALESGNIKSLVYDNGAIKYEK